MGTLALEKEETFVKPPFCPAFHPQTRRPGYLGGGIVKAAWAPSVVPAWPGESPSVYASSGKIIAEMLPGRQQRICYLAFSRRQLKKRPKLKVDPSEWWSYYKSWECVAGFRRGSGAL